MTAQVPERLVLDGQQCMLTTLLPLPKRHPRVIKTSDEEFRRQASLDPDGRVLGSSACWRSYIGAWEITDGKLYLVGLIGCRTLVGDEPLFAKWVSEMLVVPQGAMTHYVHRGFESKYERKLWITVTAGLVTGREELGSELLERIDRPVREAHRRNRYAHIYAWCRGLGRVQYCRWSRE